jgi:hypothetical protein
VFALLGHELCIAFALLGHGDCLAVIGLLPFGLSVVSVCPLSVCNVLCASQGVRGTNSGKYDIEFPVRQKHVRVKTHFRNGKSQWAQMEAVKLQDTYPLLQYIFRNGLENKKGFDWAQDMVDESERFEQLARVFKAKVDM